MADRLTAERPSHKRSKSALALSLLHRDKSKVDESREEAISDTASEAGSDTGSPTTASPSYSFSGRQTSRHKQRSTTADSPTSATSSPLTNTISRDGPPKEYGPTIEQSVRMFKLFEILRAGDRAAIARAVTDPGTLRGTTVIHLAIQCAEPEVIEQILSVAKTSPEAAVNVNARDKDGNTPLHLASMLGRPSIVRLLLEQPAINESMINYQGKTPIGLAKTPEIFQQLQLARSLYVDSKVKEIQKLVIKAQYDELERLLEDPRVENVLDVNEGELATDPNTVQSGGTLLHEAARKRDTQLIQVLLLHGADPFRRDHRGRLPQDVTKDERTRAILKKSPAAAAAQRGIQEKVVLGNQSAPATDGSPGGKESREIKGYLKKWTNYTTGFKLRWFVLEDGVLSYYKHQDDAGSACRGAINMKIAKLYMDAQDKTKFEIEGKSSVKYHLKANHVVEAKRWFWVLNNAIQWTKDEAKADEKKHQRSAESSRYAMSTMSVDALNGADASQLTGKGLVPATAVGVPLTATVSRTSLQDVGLGLGGTNEERKGSITGSNEPSLAGLDPVRPAKAPSTAMIAGDLDDEEEYGDDASDHEIQPASKDAFNITAHSASLQLKLLSQVSVALQSESRRDPTTTISHPTVAKAISTYEAAVNSLQALVDDLLKIARDRDTYWQYRLDREADVRRLWEDSMARVAKEQEELEGRIGESEDKRKRTKRALREVLEGGSPAMSPEGSRRTTQDHVQIAASLQKLQIDKDGTLPRRKSVGIRDLGRRRSTIADLAKISDSDSDEDEEFFDAVDAGEIEVVQEMPLSPPIEAAAKGAEPLLEKDDREKKKAEIVSSFKGYEDPVRTRLPMDSDDRPKISLWGILKSMIGKDMTKMTLPVSFNEPTSLLQRVAEDMEYTDLLDTAADRLDSTERMVYVAAFAASEYASTIGRVAKPFNPLLGETYEYVRPDKGYRFFIEQVSHHPPVGAAWAEAPKWDYYGESAVKSKFYGKSFDINPLGTWFLKLRPASGGEELYTWKKVTSSVIGIITGSPTVDNYGPMEIKNWMTGEVCTLDFKARGWKASSAYQVTGKVVGADGRTRWSIGGRWNDKIYARLTPGFEDSELKPSGKTGHEVGSTQAFLVWQAHERPPGIPFNLTPFAITFQSLPERLRPLLPPTDTRFRPDQRAMEDGKYDLAATEKNRLEEKQRATRRQREADGQEHVPRWFTKGKDEITGEEYWVSSGEYWRNREEVACGGQWSGVQSIF
ncbi:MAG: hypothetical protein LQ343_002627 [Gyalolechia ehrenbergii]|nr:MAG: hypothetical protein LQ343_002627 [Gyalolechia ehrenbergii]